MIKTKNSPEFPENPRNFPEKISKKFAAELCSADGGRIRLHRTGGFCFFASPDRPPRRSRIPPWTKNFENTPSEDFEKNIPPFFAAIFSLNRIKFDN